MSVNRQHEPPPEVMRLVIIKVSKLAMTVGHPQFYDPFNAAHWTPKQIIGSVRSQFGDQAAKACAKLSLLTLH
jgi:hypothetical protein